jgi:hypothetical protein
MEPDWELTAGEGSLGGPCHTFPLAATGQSSERPLRTFLPPPTGSEEGISLESALTQRAIYQGLLGPQSLAWAPGSWLPVNSLWWGLQGQVF